MKKNFVSLMGIILISAFFIGCQAHTPQVSHPDFQPVDLNAKAAEFKPKVDNFMVILDASRSVGSEEGGRTNFAVAKDFLYRMNQTMPEIELGSAIRSFGHWKHKTGQTMLDYGPTSWNQADFQAAVDGVAWGAGRSPVDQALDISITDMNSLSGKTAVILVGDGKYEEVDGVAAAKRLKDQFGSNACIYTVLVGGEESGNPQIMQEIASAGECGSYQDASDTESPQGMADWVEGVFLEKVMVAAPLDSDGDGVYDNLDQCPNTPQGVAVDAKGCPLDSDGDGVYDYLDQCPNTPKATPVDNRGCWVVKGVNFDTGKWDIKSDDYQFLDEVVVILQNNPTLKVEIQGHTDNRGAAEFNQKLSERRAIAVMEYLAGHGIAPNRLTAFGYGFSKPAASNDTPDGRAQNRRVELKPIW